MRHPCDVCRRVHRGRCKPAEQRSVSLTITVPAHLYREMTERVPPRKRAGWIARLIHRELEA